MALDQHGPGARVITIRAPASKSMTHRAYVLAARSERACTVQHPLRAADPDATLGALHSLGADVHVGRHVTFQPATLHGSDVDLQNAGTGLRLLAAQAATIAGITTLDGDVSLRSRPNGPLLDALRAGGATVAGGPKAPFSVQGPLRPGDYTLPAQVSSQFASALLLALHFADGPSTLALASPVASRPYLDLTLQAATNFGLTIEADGDTFHIAPGRPSARNFEVEGDWSSAAFLLAAAAVTSTPLHVDGLAADSAQGDRRVVDLLRRFGARIDVGESVIVRGGDLHGAGHLDIRATPDLFPILAVVAAVAPGTTSFTGGAQLRLKESDRIRAMAEGLARLGIDVDERPDGLVVHGGTLGSGRVHAYDDHRIHMAFRVAGLVAPVHVDGADSVAVSYPDFERDLARLEVIA